MAAAANRAARATKKPSKASKVLAATGRFAGQNLARAGRATGRGSATLAKRGGAALVRQVKKMPGAVFDGFVAAGAGLLSGLWHWSPTAAWKRLREVWKRRRARRADKQPKPEPQPETAATEQPKPTPATFVRRPAHASTGPSPVNGGTNMPGGGHHFVAPAMEMLRIAGAYQPQGMAEVGADFAGLADALEIYAEAMRVTVENANAKWPVEQPIVDLLAQIHNLEMKAAELARELPVAFEQLHNVDLARLRNQRTGEAMWDVQNNPHV